MMTKMNYHLTNEHIQSLITKIEYQRFGNTLTICVLTLKNGYMVTGQSACINEDSFDEQTGQQIAYEDAFKKIWPLEGYAIRSDHGQR